MVLEEKWGHMQLSELRCVKLRCVDKKMGADKASNDDLPNRQIVIVQKNDKMQTRKLLASRPGVARCSLRLQTFARPFLQYCRSFDTLWISYTVKKNVKIVGISDNCLAYLHLMMFRGFLSQTIWTIFWHIVIRTTAPHHRNGLSWNSNKNHVHDDGNHTSLALLNLTAAFNVVDWKQPQIIECGVA